MRARVGNWVRSLSRGWRASSSRRIARSGNAFGQIHAPLISAAEVADLAAQASLLARLPVREVHDHHAGDWASRWLGRGLDFEESRLYSPGDDTRDMDWRTTARTGRPHLRIYREERQPAVHLVVDRGPTMRFGTRKRLKVTQAARVSALLAFATAAHNGVIGATLWDREDETLPTGHGRRAALGLIDKISAACPPLDDPRPADALRQSDRLARLEGELPRGTRLVLLSDFAWLTAEHESALARLAARFDVRALRIIDPVEHDLPNVGLVRLHDMMSRQDVWLDTAQASVRQASRTAFSRRLDAHAASLARAGVTQQLAGCESDDLVTLLAHG